VTCPFCGAAERQLVCEKIYECGSSKLWQSKPCQELCRLREKKAQGLTWETVGTVHAASGVGGVYSVAKWNKRRGWRVSLKSEHVDQRSFGTVELAKAHAEELHQQAWRELRERWDAV
jgi:hypothetical protein